MGIDILVNDNILRGVAVRTEGAWKK